jgi:hypothetical protein
MDVFQGSDLQLALVETSSLVTLILDSSGTADVVRSQMITGDKRLTLFMLGRPFDSGYLDTMWQTLPTSHP